MAHNLEYRSDRGTSSFFSRKELAWHQLGQVVQDTVNPNEALKLANLDYEVALKPIYASFIPEGCVVRGNEPYFEVYDKQNNFIRRKIMKNVKDIFEEQQAQELKGKIKLKIQQGKEWIVENKETIIILAPVVIGGVTTITKVVGKQMKLNKEKALKDLYCYDRSLGHYWNLRRELTNNEWVAIDRRKSNGERLADILADMRVLK